ncbi:hypothetical protein SODALDRAFT_6612 [Sodiomyces alkalinus F11]|uniref:AAR2 N-terminal domain-containing protein n=1 Tax=Sodiomyces alkalinus (strain CBS 110278 / VKM F-3762 / F11) TaxID=1314773 RepID=A0A3N2Q5L8_SODAK|nr:hypothetical protein SODALDRAFT_6612 [Sodiomyces alkalinus F11]ROT42073.1 hypothetical protein SODALDRAFT_6612 [Sodiomyces alkalinus F11]
MPENINDLQCRSSPVSPEEPQPTKIHEDDALAQDILLITDLPEGYTVGCDTMTHVGFGDQCFGIRGIPPGFHFVWATPRIRGYPRCGCWVISSGKKQNIHVLQWNQYTQTLGRHVSRYERRLYRESIREHKISLFHYHCPTPASDYSGATEPATIWSRITSCISEPLLHRVVSRRDRDWRVHSDHPVRDISEPRGGAGQRRMSRTMCGGDLSFALARLARETHIEQEKTADKTGNVEMEPNDSTVHLVSFLSDQANGGAAGDSDLAGEFQFLFIAGALANNDDCLEL